jgi:hypothetical protein
MERPFVNDIESFFTEFVITQKGKRVTDLNCGEIKFENADYYFQEQDIFIELKNLEKDLFSDEDLERNERLVDKWIEEKLISKSDILAIFLRKKQIPEECLQQLFNLTRKTFQRIIEKANKQLKQSKEILGTPNSQKIVMICNDGNYLFPHHLLFSLFCSIIEDRKEIDIECSIYFTVNQTSRIPDSDLDWRLWMPAYSPLAAENMHLFVNDLGRAFNDFYNTKFDMQFVEKKEYEDFNLGMSEIEKMKFVPKEIIYKK